MAKRKGRPQLEFLLEDKFHGLDLYVYVAPPNHPVMRYPGRTSPLLGLAVDPDDTYLEIYINSEVSGQARRALLAHELQHHIEDRIPVDHLKPAMSAAESDERTHLLSGGWLYLVQHCPGIIKYLRHEC